jgi:hypothetical protein
VAPGGTECAIEAVAQVRLLLPAGTGNRLRRADADTPGGASSRFVLVYAISVPSRNPCPARETSPSPGAL